MRQLPGTTQCGYVSVNNAVKKVKIEKMLTIKPEHVGVSINKNFFRAMRITLLAKR